MSQAGCSWYTSESTNLLCSWDSLASCPSQQQSTSSTAVSLQGTLPLPPTKRHPALCSAPTSSALHLRARRPARSFGRRLRFPRAAHVCPGLRHFEPWSALLLLPPASVLLRVRADDICVQQRPRPPPHPVSLSTWHPSSLCSTKPPLLAVTEASCPCTPRPALAMPQPDQGRAGRSSDPIGSNGSRKIAR